MNALIRTLLFLALILVVDATAAAETVVLDIGTKGRVALEFDKQLLEAVQGNEIKKVKNLIAQGADVNTRNEFGETPLHLAQSKEMAEFLLSKGADIHDKDNELGMTPLFNAPKEIF